MGRQQHAGRHLRLQTSRAQLYRTANGRWVEHCDASHEFNGPDKWTFLTDEQVREWLMHAEDGEDLLEKWFPDTPDESGPGPGGGRPAVGSPINVAYPDALLKRIDAAAAAADLSRAAWLRKAAEHALDCTETPSGEKG